MGAVADKWEGVAIYADEDGVHIEEYNGIQKKYYCGKEFVRPPPKSKETHILLVIDSKEASIGFTDGETVRVVWTEDWSGVMGKHDAGGQSAQRYERGREQALIAWFRKVQDVLRSLAPPLPVIVGGPGMTKDRFVADFPNWLKERVVRIESVGYTNENGLWELIDKPRYS